MKTTFQINLAPGDYRLAKHPLPHQIETWRDQVDEILLIVDLHRSAGRFGANWEEGKTSLFQAIEQLDFPVRVVEVDYSREAKARCAEHWTGGRPISEKDFRGGPSYAYFFGLTEARGRWILHSDADLFFGGRSKNWLAEDMEIYELNDDILFMGPHAGKPTTDGRLLTLPHQSDARAKNGCQFDFMSTRLFLIDQERFRKKITAFTPKRPSLRSRIKAMVEGNTAWDLPEHWMSEAMTAAGMCRFEFTGKGDGMWSLHPPYRCPEFFEKLSDLVTMAESGDLPEEQLGNHDIDTCLVDWAEARSLIRQNRWWKRLLKR